MTTKDPAERVVAARTKLVLDQPFFGVLALRLRIVADPGCGTAWVDGRTLGYDPAFVDTLTQAELVTLLAHEVMHCAMGHPWRRDLREKDRWNRACDFAVNPILRDAGFALPGGALLDDQYTGRNAEWIHDRLPESQGKGTGKDGQGDGTGKDSGDPSPSAGQGTSPDGKNPAGSDPQDGEPSGGSDTASTPSDLGEVRDAPVESTDEGVSESEWNQAVQAAAQTAKARGKLPGSLDRFAKKAAEPRVDWRSVLRRFVEQAAPSDYTWTRPNPRFMAQRLYLPALHQDELGPLVVAVDTSGSIDDVLLSQFAAEIQGIADEAQPARVHVMYCDAALHRTDTFERGDAIEMHPVGGRGTSFVPVFDALDKLDEDPAAVIYLTDLAGKFPELPPAVPTLWATPVAGRTAPFGEIVEIQS